MRAMRLAAKAVLSLICALIAIFLFGLAGLAQAEGTRCGGYADVLADLRTSYGERIVWVGQSSQQGALVITAKTDGSTWTALLVRDETACLISAGTGWAATATGEDI